MMKVHSIASRVAIIATVLLAGSANAQGLTTVEDAGSPLLAHARVEGAPPSLSDDQRDRLRALKNQLSLDTAQKKAELKVGQSQLRELFGKAKVDKQAVLDQQSKLNTLKADLSNARVNFMLSANDVFTAEQKQAFRGRMIKRSMGRDGHHGRRGGSCGGGGGRANFGQRSIGQGTSFGPAASPVAGTDANLPST